MPNRMLRDWTGSDKINVLTPQGERFFTRLIMKVDDYGCFYADTRMLKANLFPLLLDSIREADLLRWMAECQKAGLIVLYENANKKYVQIIDFRQRLDKAKSKFPLPDENHNVNNFPESVNDFPAETEVEVETEVEQKPKGGFFKNDSVKNKKNTGLPPPEITLPFTGPEFINAWDQWKMYKKTEFKFQYKSPQSEQAALSELSTMSKGTESAAIAIIMQSMSKGWKGLFELKNTNNGIKQSTGGAVSTGSAFAKIDSMPG